MRKIKHLLIPLAAASGLALGTVAHAGEVRIGAVAPAAHHHSTYRAPAARYASHYTRNRHSRVTNRSGYYHNPPRHRHHAHCPHYGRSGITLRLPGHYDRGYRAYDRYRPYLRGHRRSGVYLSPYGLTIHLGSGH